MLTINQIQARIACSRKQHYGEERLCFIGKKEGEKGKRELLLHMYLLLYIYFYIQTGDTYNRVLLLLIGCRRKFDVHNKY